MMNHNIEKIVCEDYKSNGIDYFTKAVVDGRSVLTYYISTDMSSTNLVIVGDVIYSKTSIYGDDNIPSYIGDWMSSDGSAVPDWLVEVIMHL